MDNVQENEQPAAHVSDYLIIVWHRKLLILLTFAVLATAGLVVVFKALRPNYTAQARIAIERLRGPVEDRSGFTGEAFYQTQYQIMGSRAVAAVAAVKMGKSRSKEIALDDGSADMIRKAVAIAPERDNRVVRVSSTQTDPELAAQIVNAVIDAFGEVTRQEEARRANQFQNDLQGQIVQLEVQIDAKKRALDEFAKDKNLQQQQQEQTLVATRLSALSEAQVRAKVAREQAEQAYAELKAKYDNGEPLVENPTSNYADQLKMKIKELEQQKSLMELGKTRQGLANDPAYRQLVALIDQYQKDYGDTLKTARVDADKETMDRASAILQQSRQVEDTLSQQMAEMKLRLDSLAVGLTALARFNELKREAENLEKWHENLMQSLMQAKINDNFPVLDITEVDRARVPTEPAFPNKTQMAVVMVVMSFLVAVGLAFFLDYMDRSVKKPEDVERELRMPLLGFVPGMNSSSRDSSQRGRIVEAEPSSGPAESYRKIRAKLYVYKEESHAKVLAITSTTAGEGKTTLASNLAIAFAQAGAATLLVDADMRHPMMQGTFEIERSPGLAEFLDGKCTWQSVTRSSGIASLTLAPCGSSGERSAELLESPRLREFLAEAREQYDVVILDTPPVLGVADTTVLCHVADATIFVIQASRNAKWLVRRARMELDSAGAHIAGVVLNRVRSRRGEYYYYHRYYPKNA